MLLNTELSAITDAIQNALQMLVNERNPDRIHASEDSVRKLFAGTKEIIGQIERILMTDKREEMHKLFHETGVMLDRVERLVFKDGGIVQTLETAARTRGRSEELALNLVKMIQGQKEMSRTIVRSSQDEQNRTVGTVNLMVTLVTILLTVTSLLVLGITAFLSRRISLSIVGLVEVLKSAKEDAEASSKAKSQFLANMSHEIRTPMNGVLGLLELLKASTLREKQREYVNMALSSSSALLNVINDILDFSKMEAGRMQLVPEDFDLVQVVEDAVTLFSEQAGMKKIELLCYVSSDTPRHLRGDDSRLRQILINLSGKCRKVYGTRGDSAQGLSEGTTK